MWPWSCLLIIKLCSSECSQAKVPFIETTIISDMKSCYEWQREIKVRLTCQGGQFLQRPINLSYQRYFTGKFTWDRLISDPLLALGCISLRGLGGIFLLIYVGKRTLLNCLKKCSPWSTSVHDSPDSVLIFCCCFFIVFSFKFLHVLLLLPPGVLAMVIWGKITARRHCLWLEFHRLLFFVTHDCFILHMTRRARCYINGHLFLWIFFCEDKKMKLVKFKSCKY